MIVKCWSSTEKFGCLSMIMAMHNGATVVENNVAVP